MSNLIYDLLRPSYRLNRYDGQYGLEIETETMDAYVIPTMKLWDPKTDGSLRNFGYEYVLRAPLNFGTDLDSALKEFKDKTLKVPFIQDSITTSVHVHINMLNSTFLTLANFLTAYSLTENLLIKFSGPDRLSNLFCLPICDAEGINQKMVELVRNIDSNQYTRLAVSPDRAKYGAVNLATLTTLGTIEIRSFRGVTDTDVIRNWVSLLNNLFLYASQNITPLDIIEQYRASGPEIVGQIYGASADLINYNNKDELVKKNVWYASSIAAVSKDWSKFGIPKTKKVSANKFKGRLEDAAFRHFNLRYDQLNEIQQLAVNEVVQRDFDAQNAQAPVDFNFRNNNLPAVQAVVAGAQAEFDNDLEDLDD